MKFDLVVRGGTLIFDGQTFKADIAIKKGRISAIGEGPFTAFDYIDASNCYVMPGIIDVHTHIWLDLGSFRSSDTWLTGTRAAAAGGVTSIIDFAPQGQDGSILEGISQRINEASSDACVDWGLHGTIYQYNKGIPGEMKKAVARGISSFKEFTIYRERGWQSDAYILYESLNAASKAGGMITLHAESDSMVVAGARINAEKNRLKPFDLSTARPPISETEAISSACHIASESDGSLYIVHITTPLGARIVGESRMAGARVWGETCPQYLTLSSESLKGSNGYLYTCCPPLRPEGYADQMWNEILSGDLSVIATDHCPFMKKTKLKGKKDFRQSAFGLPGVQTLLPIMWSEGVMNQRLTPIELVELLSAQPARLFGLYPRKGTLRPGSDADITILDPRVTKIIKADKLDMNTDYSPYQGRSVTGWPTHTILRGNIIYNQGTFNVKPGFGKFLKRKPFSPPEKEYRFRNLEA